MICFMFLPFGPWLLILALSEPFALLWLPVSIVSSSEHLYSTGVNTIFQESCMFFTWWHFAIAVEVYISVVMNYSLFLWSFNKQVSDWACLRIVYCRLQKARVFWMPSLVDFVGFWGFGFLRLLWKGQARMMGFWISTGF